MKQARSRYYQAVEAGRGPPDD